MRTRLTIGLAVAGLLLAACGSDDGGSSDVSGARADAAQSAIESAEASGVPLDEGCVNDLAAQLSDEDAEILADSGAQDADLSPEGEALTTELLGCADQDALVDLFVEGMTESGEDIDEDCAREKLQDVDIAELVASTEGGSPPPDVIAALVDCFDFGS